MVSLRGIAVLVVALGLAGTTGAEVEVTPYKFGIWRALIKDGQERFGVPEVIVGDSLDAPRVAQGAQSHPEGTILEVLNADGQEQVVFRNQAGEALVTMTSAPAEGDEISAKIVFHGATTIYGLPERATDLALKDGSKYRLFNQDVYKYAVPDDKNLYGSIPFIMAHSARSTYGIFMLNSADSTWEVSTDGGDRVVNFSAKGGSTDIFFLPGPNPIETQQQLASLTGKQHMPPLFATAYHQCRWNYRSEDDVLQVDENFDKYDIPYDVIWLDIEHTNGKQYFTWDQYNFPTPEKMQNAIAAKGRKMVTITDPHIKRAPGYHIFDEASSKGYFVKNTEGTADYEGHCWPGTSSWLDFLNPDVREWYATQFKYSNYKGSTKNLYTWIDMNEPAVFNTHEQTFDMNNVHHGGVKHRDVHNIYGHLHTMSAYNGHLVRSEHSTRPFVLTRSFFSGTQRFGAVWTGDNAAEWSHLNIATPMLLSLSLSNLPFVGADVGGFFDNPETDLLVRWYQAACFTPFFRAHAHLETKRREPWLHGDDNTKLIRAAIARRYQVLPYIYTLFFKSHALGRSVLNPAFFFWPEDEKTFELQDSFMVGRDLLIRPVIQSQATSASFYLPDAHWYNFFTGAVVASGSGEVTVECPIEQGIPVLQRGGSIIPTRNRHRRSSAAQLNDPYTLNIALDSSGAAEGDLYIDDTHSFDYQQGSYLLRRFRMEGGVISSSQGSLDGPYASQFSGSVEIFPTPLHVERVRVYGLTAAPASVALEYPNGISSAALGAEGMARITPDAMQTRHELEFDWDATFNVLTIRRPQALVALDWTITLA